MARKTRTPLVGIRGGRVIWRCAPLLLACGGHAPAGDFAAVVVSYEPAPGQFVNNSQFNDPARALGPPVGAGIMNGDTTKVVTLGGYGGSITLGFSETVLDDPCNPFGLDAIVFGNAFWASGDPTRRFAEGAVIEISLDENANGIADDAWYVIPGPSLPSTPDDAHETQAWDDDPGTSTPPANTAWYPAGAPSPMATQTFRLPSEFETHIVENPSGDATGMEIHFGYGEMSPVLLLGDLDADDVVEDGAIAPGEFYTRPDNPREVGVTPGSAGGDAFDIAWAVDPATGEAPRLPGFDFIRISTGVNHVAGILGEVSSEVGGVADVRPDPESFDVDGDATPGVEDIYAHQQLVAQGDNAADLNGDGVIGAEDQRLLRRCARRGEVGDVSEGRLP